MKSLGWSSHSIWVDTVTVEITLGWSSHGRNHFGLVRSKAVVNKASRKVLDEPAPVDLGGKRVTRACCVNDIFSCTRADRARQPSADFAAPQRRRHDHGLNSCCCELLQPPGACPFPCNWFHCTLFHRKTAQPCIRRIVLSVTCQKGAPPWQSCFTVFLHCFVLYTTQANNTSARCWKKQSSAARSGGRRGTSRRLFPCVLVRADAVDAMDVHGFEGTTRGVSEMFNNVISAPGIPVGSREADQLDAAALGMLRSSGLTPRRIVEEGFELGTLCALDVPPTEAVAAVVANGWGRAGPRVFGLFRHVHILTLYFFLSPCHILTL